MTGRSWRAALLAAAWLAPVESPLSAQASSGSLGLGASVIEYDGFLRSGAATLAPALQFETATLSLGARGTWTIFESGNQIWQGTAGWAWLIPSTSRWRIELGGSAGSSKYAGQPAEGYALGRTRLHLSGEEAGGWIGVMTGASFGESDRLPFEISLSGWRLRKRWALAGSMVGTWLGQARHLDLIGAARWTGSDIEVEARVGARPWAESGGGVGEARTSAFAEVTSMVALSDRFSLSLSAGTYPSDPVRRVLGATYLSAGVLWRPVGIRGPARSDFAGLSPSVRAVSGDQPRLEIGSGGDSLPVRVHVAAASSVELRGDFTDWEPVPLRRVDATVWEARLPVAPGVHRVMIRINQGAWLPPAGTRPERTEFGDLVGLVLVPPPG